MTEDLTVPPTGPNSSAPTVVEWGSDPRFRRVAEGTQHAEPRRNAWSRLMIGPRLDNRVVPVIAGIGGIAIFASFIGEWQITMTPGDNSTGSVSQRITVGLGGIDGWNTGYLMGVFAVVACSALALFGAPPVRHYARLVGLAMVGALGAMLVAATVELGRSSVVYSYLRSPNIEELQSNVEYGRGLYMAFIGAGALALALYLTGRLAPPPAGDQAGTSDAVGRSAQRDPQPPSGVPGTPSYADDADDGRARWWRRGGAPKPSGPPSPADLTVGPALPFAQTTGDIELR
jgi:hypothetical protein